MFPEVFQLQRKKKLHKEMSHLEETESSFTGASLLRAFHFFTWSVILSVQKPPFK